MIEAYEEEEYEKCLVFGDKIYEFCSKNPVVNYYCAMAHLRLDDTKSSLKYFPLVIS